MKVHKITGFTIAVTIGLSVFAPTAALANESDVVKLATNSKAAAQKSIWDRGIKDLEFHGNEIYSGYGNYDTNIGPIDLISHNLNTGAETNHITMDGEEIERIRSINGSLYAPNIDPKAPWTWNVGYTSNESGTWRNSDATPFIHVFDVASTGDDLWLAGSIVNPDKALYGESNHLAAVKRSIDGGETWTIEKARASDSSGSNDFDRNYWLVSLDGKIYTNASTNQSANTMDVWENGAWTEEITQNRLNVYDADTIGSKILMRSDNGLIVYDVETKEESNSLYWPNTYIKDMYVDKEENAAYALRANYLSQTELKLLKSYDGVNWSEPIDIDISSAPGLEEISSNGDIQSYSQSITSIAIKNNVAYYGMNTGDIFKSNLPEIATPVQSEVTLEPLVAKIGIKDLAKAKTKVKALDRFGKDITPQVNTKTISKWNGTIVRYTVTDDYITKVIEIPVDIK